MKAKHVITIAREFGSNGREIGIKLAQHFEIPFYDRELVRLACERGGLDEDFMAENEEKSPIVSTTVFARKGFDIFYQPSLSDTIFLEQSKIIREMAAKGPCVIVGRAADYVLRDMGSVDVFISAGMDYKIARRREKNAPQEQELSDEQLEKYIRNIDKQRRKYYEHYTGRRWGMIGNYHLCIWVDDIGTDGAVDIILKYIDWLNKEKED